MQFTEYGKDECLKGWRFNGVCEDTSTGKVYMFCTNSIYEAREFKSEKELLGMKFISGKYNATYKVVRKLLEK